MWVWVIVSLFVFVLWLIGKLTRVKKMDGWTVLGSVILANTIQMQKNEQVGYKMEEGGMLHLIF